MRNGAIMDTELAGKRVRAPGGSRGIGRAIVLAAGRAGARLVTCGRAATEDAASLERELKELGAEAWFVTADVTEPADAERLARECGERLGGPGGFGRKAR